jgi:hypothetical protein
MAELTHPVPIIDPVFDFSNPGTIMNSLQSEERQVLPDAKAGSQSWQTWSQCMFTLNSDTVITPDYHQLQLLITGGTGPNGTFQTLVNEAIAIECGAPIYQRGRCLIGGTVREDNTLMYKTQIVEGFVNQELSYSLGQAQDDGFWYPDSQGCLWGPQTNRTSSGGPMLYNSGNNSVPPSGNYPAIWDLNAGTTGSGYGAAALFPPISVINTTGNYPQWFAISNRYYNPGLISRMGRTSAVDPNDGSIFLRVPIVRTFPSFRDLPYIVGAQTSFQMNLTPQPYYWLTTTPGSPTPVVTVQNSQLWYTIYQPVSSLRPALNQFLNSGKEYEKVFQAWDGVQLPLGSGTVNLTTLKGQAEYVWIYFQTATRDTTYTCLKSYAEQLFPTSFNLSVGGVNIPMNVYNPVNQVDVRRQWRDFIRSSNYDTVGSAGGQMTFPDWVSYYPIYAFKIPQQELVSTTGQQLALQIQQNPLYPFGSNVYNINCVIKYQKRAIVKYIGGKEQWGNPV